MCAIRSLYMPEKIVYHTTYIMQLSTGKFFREERLPEQKVSVDGVHFPMVLSPATTTNITAFEEAIRAEMQWLESLLKKSGAILFRGFPVSSPSDFNNVVEAFGFPEALYVGGRAPRTKVVGRIYTANESPMDKRIPFHHEMNYVPDFPSKLFFFCEEEPGEGGETPIVLSNVIYEKMKEKQPEFVGKLEKHGVKYTTVAGDEDHPSAIAGRGWKSTYMTHDKKVAEERAAKLGTKLEWMGNVVKMIIGPMPAIKYDEERRIKTWFNNLTGPVNGDDKVFDQATCVDLGNGELVPNDAMEDCVRFLEEECVVIPWKKGDIMLVDNLKVLHSRQPLLKPPRRILVALCK
ncbi:putative TauD/TfdA-like domain, taurine dioxygenase TauD-like superfamily [Helianthus annuus]|uniref:Putative tauD/TfdA-like domain-containing protein n=1 Tax=Helianthus annuus TaxID=4232 RepID=A0A251UQQ8_HELAN|nr:putative TauD/TfdA-like domain, taurine dioxygenase TauD-like superfamily [Helianthus annuus]KAJ0584077.1 putative TauD/TfdA-like domain, taurine dioxygenase TauD-like superfamily [Helianthus annuus]KAJ0749744.1 putative TauD/TfdA-like domain, taurine dioxygenase TauD-like superfamily [Helianthus annuus]KAJ0918367.1 putative TauD/TfdA-like domain, taurine dioxygenase TauD-like superfamily [Helianthus annuus]